MNVWLQNSSPYLPLALLLFLLLFNRQIFSYAFLNLYFPLSSPNNPCVGSNASHLDIRAKTEVIAVKYSEQRKINHPDPENNVTVRFTGARTVSGGTSGRCLRWNRKPENTPQSYYVLQTLNAAVILRITRNLLNILFHIVSYKCR